MPNPKKRRTHGLNRQLFNKVSLSLWQPSNENIDPETHAALVNQLYVSTRALILGALSFAIILIAIAIENDLPELIDYTVLVFAPANVVRYGLIEWYRELPAGTRHDEAPAFEAHYAVSTIAMSVLIQIPTIYVLIYGGVLAQASVALYSLTVAIAIASRNAGMRRLVITQCAIMLTPFAVEQAIAFTPITLANAFSVVLLGISILKLSAALQKDAEAARQRAAEDKRIAQTDPLTGLLNRQGMQEILPDLVRQHAGGLSLILIDIDDLRSVNDLHGQPIGDGVLTEIGARLHSHMHFTPHIACSRQTDDSFLVAVPGPPVDGGKLINMLVEKLRGSMKINGRDIIVTCSMGIAHSRYGNSVTELLRNVDCALEHAKESGRGRFAIYTPELASRHNERARLEQRLHMAVANDEITIVFQPIIDMATGEIASYEALARWEDAELGHVPPSRFIPLAEEIGLISMLTENILTRACKAAASWDSVAKVAVNVSAVQFNTNSNLHASICKALDISGLPGKRLEIEITESVMLGNHGTVSDILAKCQNEGISIALDDFGSGYCSLSYLSRVPFFSKIKIDRALTEAACSSNIPAQILVKMVCELAETLQADVVTEGIETPHQAAAMAKLGARFAQGYLFGRPTAQPKMKESIAEQA